MTDPVSQSGPIQPVGTEAALQRSAYVALILSVSVFGLAGVYFAALYLIAR